MTLGQNTRRERWLSSRENTSERSRIPAPIARRERRTKRVAQRPSPTLTLTQRPSPPRRSNHSAHEALTAERQRLLGAHDSISSARLGLVERLVRATNERAEPVLFEHRDAHGYRR